MHGKQDSSAAAHEVIDPIQNPTLMQLQGQLHSAQLEIANREQAIATLNAKDRGVSEAAQSGACKRTAIGGPDARL